MNLKRNILIACIAGLLFSLPASNVYAQQDSQTNLKAGQTTEGIKDIGDLPPIFDDKALLDGYRRKYDDLSKDVLIEMIKDSTLSTYKTAAAVRTFKDKFADEVVGREKKIIEKHLLRCYSRTDSPFVQLEILHTLCIMDRYKYFAYASRALIQKLDHYNQAVNDLAYDYLNHIIKRGQNRAREARIVFNTLRKILFLSRQRLAVMKHADGKLYRKIELLRWSIKILGTQELKRLPKEVLHLL